MLDSLITSKTRIKLLLKFFLNTSTHAYLRGLADEFGESTNASLDNIKRKTHFYPIMDFFHTQYIIK